MRLYEIKLAESKDGHWQNIRKYVGDQVMLTSKDRKPAERCVEFMAGIIQEVDSFIVECKTLRSNLFDKENTVKPWKANELLFLENIIKDLSAIDTKMVKAKGDIFQNVCYLRRRVLESEAIQHDNSRSKRRMKENKRKSSNRKEQRKLRSCCKKLGQEIINRITGIEWRKPYLRLSTRKSSWKESSVSTNKYIFLFTLLLSNDINVNPGPVSNLKCQICLKTIRRNQALASCSECNVKFHSKCWDTSNMNPLSVKCQFCASTESSTGLLIDGTEQIQFPSNWSKLMSSRGLKICHQNICGLFNKIDLLRVNFDLMKELHILGISESHLTKDITDPEISISGYNIFRRDRQNNNYGGIVVYVKETVNSVRREDLESDFIEGIWLEILFPNTRSILVGNFYRPPEGSLYLSPNFDIELQNMLTSATCEKKEIIILGDFNYDFLNPTSGRTLKENLKDNGLMQIIKDPTRITNNSSTLIDIIGTTQTHNISTSAVIQNSMSDHDMIGCVRKVNNLKFAPRTVTVSCRNYKHYNPEQFISDLKRLNFSSNMNMDVDTV
ncbi:Hypothetical predicted protein [Paramuricea clavata]|uniref:Uncharacterized protein n=1 Tax=Paramuricea clavata TaxID=317549 RepID=A0A6S7FUH8_PARCT|nr:Hypothetical predicted protein [Paramuricea clavata]